MAMLRIFSVVIIVVIPCLKANEYDDGFGVKIQNRIARFFEAIALL